MTPTSTGLRDRAERFLALAEKATPGRWVHYDDTTPAGKTGRHEVVALGRTVAHIYYSDAQGKSDASLIVAAKTDAPDIIRALLASPAPAAPIPMVIRCPHCHAQHIDKPEPGLMNWGGEPDSGLHRGWDNPPHTSHLCHNCGAIWRDCSVETTGVESVPPGKHDRPPTDVATPPAEARDLVEVSVVRMEEAGKGESWWVQFKHPVSGHTLTPHTHRIKGRSEYEADTYRALFEGRDPEDVDPLDYEEHAPASAKTAEDR